MAHQVMFFVWSSQGKSTWYAGHRNVRWQWWGHGPIFSGPRLCTTNHT